MMNTENSIQPGDYCKVISGTHKGKEGKVGDFNIIKTGHLTVTVTMDNGIRFKTLGKNVEKIAL